MRRTKRKNLEEKILKLESEIEVLKKVSFENSKETNRLLKENDMLKKEKEELEITVNILRTEQDNKSKEQQKNMKKWLGGYHGETFEEEGN